MALLWIEGFEGFGTSTGAAPSPSGIVGRKYPGIYKEASNMDIETGRYGYCLEIYSDSYLQSPNLTTNATTILGCAIKAISLPSGAMIFSLYDSTTLGVNLRVNIDGTLSAYLGSSTLLGSSTNAIGSGTWYYIELKVLTHNTTGTVDIKVNGTSWLSLTNQDTQPGANAYHTAFRLGMGSGNYTHYDDVYFLDGSGAGNNDFLGNRKVVALNPDGAGSSTAWTPSAGSNYENVDDGSLMDEDSTYNETSTDAHQDLYTYDDLPEEALSVDGIQITSEARVTAGSMDLSNVIKSGTTTDTGTPETVTSTDYVTVVRLEELDPDISNPWTPSTVNGAEFGIKANT